MATEYSKFDIIVAEFPFIDDRTKVKIRPAVVVSSDEYNKRTGFVVIAMITSAKHSKLWNDVEINGPEKIDLKEPSIIRMKFANIVQDDILGKLGRLDTENEIALQKKLGTYF